MCDDTTEAENEAHLEEMRLTRREVGLGAGAAITALLMGCKSQPTSAKQAESARPSATRSAPSAVSSAPEPAIGTPTSKPASRMVTIETPDGRAEAFFVAPEGAQHPGVLMWPDVAGLRDAYEKMATRLAGEGYAVLVVNHYYRSTKMPIFNRFSEWRTDKGRAKIAPMKEAITPEGTAKDGAAFVAWLDRQKEVDTTKKIATTGYCMGGPYTFRTAAAVPERVGVIASFHGGGLVTDSPTSPHLLFAKMKAAALICIAQNDHERQPDAKTTLEKAAQQTKIPTEIEIYPAQHGWCTIDSPVYDEEQAERAWARMLETFTRHL